MPEARILVNTRTLASGQMTGVQRYTSELLGLFGEQVETVAPPEAMDGLGGHLWEQLELPRLLRGRLLWSPSNTGPLAVAGQVVTVHDMATLDHPEWFDRKFALCYRGLVPRLARRVRQVITVSEYSRHRIVTHAGVPHSKVSVIPLAADGRFHPVSEQERDFIRLKFALPERFVLCVGSLEPRKNLGRLFAAWEAWTDRPRGLRLVVVGGQGQAFRGVGFDQPPRDVQLLGRVDDADLPALYGAAEVFVYPSVYEGFGLPPLEAMACGTAVITSGVTSLPEVVGDAAILVDPFRVESLVGGLRQVFQDDDLREELCARGLVRAQQFSWARAARETWEVLERAAQE